MNVGRGMKMIDHLETVPNGLIPCLVHQQNECGGTHKLWKTIKQNIIKLQNRTLLEHIWITSYPGTEYEDH